MAIKAGRVAIVTGAAQERVVAALTKVLLQIVNCICKERVGRVCAHDTDGMHGVETETSCKDIWSISDFFHYIQYFLSGRFADIWIAV